MRKQFFLSLLVALLTTLSLHAYDFQSGDLYYNITSDTTVEVTYQKKWSSTNYQGLTTATIPETVTYNDTTYSVTSIGREAFWDCSSLTSITLPNSVTSIGRHAFWYCSALTSVTLGNSVTSIGNYAFAYCSALTSITIGNSVTSIGSCAFISCFSLTSITIPNSVTTIGDDAFYNVPNIVYSGTATGSPWGARSVNGYVDGYLVYADETKMTLLACSAAATGEVTIPYSVTSIGERAFEYCSSLTSITLPNSVTSIGYRAFYGCSSLTSVTIGNSVTSIGSSAFYNCSSLTSVTIGNSVTSIGESAFYNCSSLTSITLPNSVTRIGNYAFRGCYSLTSITLPNSVTSIGNYAFDGCTSLPVEDNLRYADTYLVEAVDKSLSTYTIKAGTKWIGSYAFSYCDSITSITIPNSVTGIGSSAFGGCSSLTSVTSLSCTPPTCGSDVFYYTPSEKILTVPSISIEAYKKNSIWEAFTSFDSIVYPSLSIKSSNNLMGTVQIEQDVDCDSVAIISAIANLGYQFTQWSDGNTENPRTIKLTQDTTLTAEFGLAYSGKCGDDLYWTYSNKEVKITGTGAMYNYTDSTMPWTLLRDSIKTVRVGNNATSIGAYAFSSTPKLAELHIGTNVEDIGANAFSGCKRLYDIYCYPTYPPFAETNSFANYNVYVYVPCENLRDYTLNVVWGEFKFIECIGSEDVEVFGNEVTVSPSYEDATFTWPITDGAETYSLVITKDGVTFCTLVFNAQGQLLSITFNPRRQNAPAAEGTTPATYAEMTANGFRFTVTGLDEGAAYAYTLTVRNAANTVLDTYTGNFTTLSNTPTGINESTLTGRGVAGQVEKIIRDGQVVILRNGETYDMMGQRL